MDPDELEPRKPRREPLNLDTLSVEELEAYIGELNAEIDRVKTKLAAKRAHLTAAQTLFRK
jgi:uncharacterized small protein (DUF1192 family)